MSEDAFGKRVYSVTHYSFYNEMEAFVFLFSFGVKVTREEGRYEGEMSRIGVHDVKFTKNQ